MIGKKSMIQRVYEQTQKSSAVTRTVVATDDTRILNAVTAFGGEAVMTSQACRSGTDRVAETANLLNISDDEIIVNIQGDQPIFNPLTIDEMISAARDGRLKEAFGTGTAAVISPVGQITYEGEDHIVAGGKMGDLSQRLYNEIVAIQYGEKEDPYEWMERIS